MTLSEKIISTAIIRIINDMEALAESILVDNDASIIEQANMSLKNKPIITALMKKQVLLRVLNGV